MVIFTSGQPMQLGHFVQSTQPIVAVPHHPGGDILMTAEGVAKKLATLTRGLGRSLPVLRAAVSQRQHVQSVEVAEQISVGFDVSACGGVGAAGGCFESCVDGGGCCG
jgi:hypothetical protein